MTRRQRLQLRRRRGDRSAYNHRAELARVRSWLAQQRRSTR